MNLDDLTPQQRAEELRKRLGKSEPAQLQVLSKFDADLIPDVIPERSEEDKQIDTVIDSIDIVEAYTRFIGKSSPTPGSKTEGIKVSCPMPGHPDKNPSAWLNSEKKTWFCGACQKGGDIYDLAAIKLGYDLDGYKSKDQFPKLRRQLAGEYGFSEVRGVGGKKYLQAPIPPPPDLSGSSNGKVLNFPTVVELDDEEDDIPKTVEIDWEDLVTENTFLRAWMDACTVDDLPHEYYFWLGLQAIGFTANRNVWLKDSPNVYPNLFVCLYGPTGVGKSRSLRPYLQLLRSTLDFTGDKDKYNDPRGVKQIPSPNSAEALLDSFAFEVLDPGTNAPHHRAPVTGLLKVEEFAAFVARASRPGSTLKDVLIDLYDCHHQLTSHSRGSGRTVAINPFCQVVTTTQPKAIHAFLRKTDTESGFLNRWVLAAGRPRKTPISYGSVHIDLEETEHYFRDLVVWTSATAQFTLKGDAYKAWDNFFQTNIAEYKLGVKDMDTMASRIDLTLKKVIILLTINEMLEEPTAEIVEKAVSLFRYLNLTYNAFGKDIIFNDVTDCQQRIIHAIEKYQIKYKKFPTRREIIRNIGNKFDTEIQVKAFRHLAELDIIQELPPTKEHQTTRYRYAEV